MIVRFYLFDAGLEYGIADRLFVGLRTLASLDALLTFSADRDSLPPAKPYLASDLATFASARTTMSELHLESSPFSHSKRTLSILTIGGIYE